MSELKVTLQLKPIENKGTSNLYNTHFTFPSIQHTSPILHHIRIVLGLEKKESLQNGLLAHFGSFQISCVLSICNKALLKMVVSREGG